MHMGQYAEVIAGRKLYKTLENSAGRDDIKETDVKSLLGMVAEVADQVGPTLELIPQTFAQYTKHDIHHCDNLINLMGSFIPEQTLERLNALELTMLLLSALLHDVGMAVTNEEKQAALDSGDFERFRTGQPDRADRAKAIKVARQAGKEIRARAIEDALLAEYYRRMHPQRASKYIADNLAPKQAYSGRFEGAWGAGGWRRRPLGPPGRAVEVGSTGCPSGMETSLSASVAAATNRGLRTPTPRHGGQHRSG